jgi:hypothetical protein
VDTGSRKEEVDTGSRKENASKQESGARSDSIGTEKAPEYQSFLEHRL